MSPFKLAPFFQTRIWGFRDLAPWFDFKTEGEPVGEVWLTGEKCTVATGPLTGQNFADIMKTHSAPILGEAYAAEAEFPLLVKILFPKDKLSVQVHPDDALAQQKGEPRGKTECWYVLEAEPDANIALGLKPGVTPDQVRAAIEDKTMEELLGIVPIKAGDMIYVDAGTVHALWPGAVILETQQTSDTTYRLYDYGRPRPLHIDLSLEAMRVKTAAGKLEPKSVNGHSVLLDERYFRVERWKLADDAAADALAQAAQPGVKAASLLFVNDGALTIEGEGFESFVLGKCELAVVPASAGAWTARVNGPAEVMHIVPYAN